MVPGVPLDRRFLIMLSQRQPNLTLLSIPANPGPLLEIIRLPVSPPDWLSTLTELRLPITAEDIQNVEAYNEILVRATGLKSLSLRNNTLLGPDSPLNTLSLIHI